MRTKAIITILAAILLMPLSGKGQGVPQIRVPETDLWPESPRAWAFRKVMTPTPALATGAAVFSVPLYTVDVKGFTLPISLSYRSNGVRPNDEWLPVGYGWSLLPVLRVNRRIVGRPDGYFPFNGDYIPVSGPDAPEEDYLTMYRSITQKNAGKTDTLSNRFDPEHDIFTIYLADATLTAVYDNGKITAPGSGEYTISNDPRLNYIKVTDPVGNTYDFSVPGQESNGDRTEWLLKEITLADGEKITVTWKTAFKGVGQDFQDPITVDYGNYQGSLPYFESDINGSSSWSREYNYSQSKEIETIGFPGGRAEFQYHGELGMITAMQVYNSKTGTEKIFEATFSHLDRLLSCVDLGAAGKYDFEYDPNRFHNPDGRDMWGYYNGKYNDYQLSPSMTVNRCDSLDIIRRGYIYGADRHDDFNYIQANILKKVTYPTGGTCSWEYEPHSFEPCYPDSLRAYCFGDSVLTRGGGVRVKRITMSPSASSSEQEIVTDYIYGRKGDGKGICEHPAFPSTFISLQKRLVYSNKIANMLYEDYLMTVERSSKTAADDAGTETIWYPRVTEISTEGKTVHDFEYVVPAKPRDPQWQSHNPMDVTRTFSPGLQETKTSYYKNADEGGYALVHTDSTVYKTDRLGAYRNMRVWRNIIQTQDKNNSPDFGEDGIFHMAAYGIGTMGDQTAPYDTYGHVHYDLVVYKEKISGRISTEYTGTGAVTTRQSFGYLPGTGLMDSETTTDGNSSVKTEVTYAMSDAATWADLCAIGQKGYPVSTKTTGPDGSLTVTRSHYHISGNMALTDSVSVSYGTATAMTAPWASGRYEYDTKGNLIKMTDKAGTVTRWTWDAAGLYPLTRTVGDRLTEKAEWKPLVGVTALTLPSGQTSAFSYDSAGRLISQSLNGRLRKTWAYSTANTGVNSASGTNTGNAVTERTQTDEASYIETHARADGLGRVYASFAPVAYNGTNGLNTGYVASLTGYDLMGRAFRAWQPAPASDTSATPETLMQSAMSFYGDSNPWSETHYEASQREQPEATLKAGSAWHQARKTSTRRTFANTASGLYACPQYGLTAEGVEKSGNWPAGTLTVTEETDEDGIRRMTWTDFRGLTVRTLLDGAEASPASSDGTDYVYDGFGRLRYVLPPGLEGTMSATDGSFLSLGYRYDYDARGLLITKKLPGASEIHYRHDPSGRPVAYRDGRHEAGQWTLTAYDVCGRQALCLRATLTEAELDSWLSVCRRAVTATDGAMKGYALQPAFSTVIPLETVSARYYDGYDWIAANGLGDEFNYGGKPSTPPGSVTIPLEPEDGRWLGPATGLLSGIYTSGGFEAYYYDTDGNQIESYATGYNTGRKDSYYNYVGAVTKEKFSYPAGSGLPSMEKSYTYTATGLPLTQTVTCSPWVTATPSVPSDPIIIPSSVTASGINTELPVPTAKISRSYDRLGRVSRLYLGDNATVDYEYDVHGWLTSQTLTCADTVMTMSLAYAGSARPRYNGFISRKDWNGRSYLYEYDGKGRLIKADYTASVSADSDENFSAEYSYDCRGNITSLKRKGITDRTGSAETFGTADNMTISYKGNRMSRVDHTIDTPVLPPFVGRLQSVPEAADADSDFITIEMPEDFAYNDAGDLTRDDTRSIVSITRNTEGRPTEVRFSDGHVQRTVWDMGGNKLSTQYLIDRDVIALGGGLSEADYGSESSSFGGISVDTTGIGPVFPEFPTTYLYTRKYTGDGHVIKTNVGGAVGVGTVIESIQFDGGYFDNGSGANYYVRDYLGNVIAVVNQGGHLVQATDYYPYGLPFRMPEMTEVSSNAFSATVTNRYLFGGKEFLTEDGLNEYYQEARQYIPRIPRFDRMDEKIDDYRDFTPYLAFGGNPVMNIDPDGKDIWEINSSGEVVKRIKNNEYDSFYIVDDEGNRIENKSLELKSKSVIKAYSKKDNKGNKYDTYKIRGDNNATKLFEFLAKNTTVEWSQAETGIEGKKGLNFITSSHDHLKEKGVKDLIINQLSGGYTVRTLNHSHPENTPIPSGLYPDGEPGDIQAARLTEKILQQTPSFNIFLPGTSEYVSYSPDSTPQNYESANKIQHSELNSDSPTETSSKR